MALSGFLSWVLHRSYVLGVFDDLSPIPKSAWFDLLSIPLSSYLQCFNLVQIVLLKYASVSRTSPLHSSSSLAFNSSNTRQSNKSIIMSYTSTIIVTGGTSGLGYNASLILAQQNPDSLIIVSSRKDSPTSASSINKTLNQKNAVFVPLDLANLSNVRAFASTFSQNI